VVDDVKTFAMPALHSLASGKTISKHWKAGAGMGGGVTGDPDEQTIEGVGDNRRMKLSGRIP
jgi:hypothetical protein